MGNFMNERNFQRKCIAAAKENGWLAYKFASPAHRGVPDVIFIKDFDVVFVEFKRPDGKGKLTKLQEHTIKDMRFHGARVQVIDSWEDFYAYFIE